MVNNAGIMANGRTDEIDIKKLKDTVDINVTHVGMMTSLFLPRLLKRERSALINVSSMIAFFEGCAGSAVYCASKAYDHFLTTGIARELEGKNVDILSFTPGMGATNLWEEKSKKNFLGVSAQAVVSASLRDLGKNIMSVGHWNHDTHAWTGGIISSFSIVQYIFSYVYGTLLL